MYVWFLPEIALTMYTCSFSSAISENVEREAMIMMSLQHQNTPFPLGISTEPISKLLVMSYYDTNDKAFTMYSALHNKSLHLSQAIFGAA